MPSRQHLSYWHPKVSGSQCSSINITLFSYHFDIENKSPQMFTQESFHGFFLGILFCFSDTFEISRNYRAPIKRYPIDDPKDVSKMTVQHETFRWAYNCAQNAKTYFYLVIKTVKIRPKRDGSSRDIHMMRKRLPFRHLKDVK